MSLADLVAEELTPKRVACKTCKILAGLPEQDRDEFNQLAASGTLGSVLGRALVRRAAQVGITDTVAEGSVRQHIRDGHEPR